MTAAIDIASRSFRRFVADKSLAANRDGRDDGRKTPPGGRAPVDSRAARAGYFAPLAVRP